MYYLNCFFVYSILGFLFEHIVSFVTGSKGDSGIFYGPYTPVYGIGVILIILISDFIFKHLEANKIIQSLTIFFAVCVVLSLIELLGGVLIEKLFHTTYWDYSHLRFHIGRYIALEIALIWGVLALLVIYVIRPLLDRLILHIPPYLTYSLLLIFLFDCFVTVLAKTKIKDHLLMIFRRNP